MIFKDPLIMKADTLVTVKQEIFSLLQIVFFNALIFNYMFLKHVQKFNVGFQVDLEQNGPILRGVQFTVHLDVELNNKPESTCVVLCALTLITVICTIFCAKNISFVKYFLWPDFTLPRGLAESTSGLMHF